MVALKFRSGISGDSGGKHTNVALMLAHRLRRWPSFKPTWWVVLAFRVAE